MTEIEHIVEEYEQNEQNFIDFEGLRFGDTYLDYDKYARKIENKRKMKKEKDYV